MSTSAIFFDALVVGFVLLRQWRVRPVPLRLHLGVPIVLGVIGLLDLSRYADAHPLGNATTLWVLLWVGLGAGLGALRGLSARIWRADGPFRWVVRRGTWATMALWALSIGLHLTLGGRAADASLLLSLGLGYGVQRAVEQARAAKLRGLDPVGTGPGRFAGLRAFRVGGFGARGFDPFGGFGGFGAPPGPTGPSGQPGTIEADSEVLPPHPDDRH